MTSIHRQARLLQASVEDTRHKWPTMSPAECERAKDAAFTVMVALIQAGRDASACRAQYMNTVHTLEQAAGYSE